MSEERKNGKGLILLVIVLVLIIIGLVGYICYDKLYKNNTSNDNIQENTPSIDQNNNDNDVESISINSQDVNNVLKSFNSIFISEDNLYKSNSYSIANISDYDLIATAISNIDDKYIAYCITDESQLKESISMQELNNAISNYILNKKITLNTFKSLKEETSETLEKYAVNNMGITLDDNGIKLIGPCGAGGFGDDYVNKNIVKAEKYNEYLYVYEKQAFARYSDNSRNGNPLVDYYKDYNKTKVIEKDLDSIELLDNNGKAGSNSTPNWELYDTYKYTFKKVNGIYYFQSLELTK